MRPLALHISALTDPEYELYTSILNELCDTNDNGEKDDDYYESVRISVREARAWMRGRFAAVGGKIDSILRFFSNLEPGDTISGGQLFAALRMVVHVEQGREVDRGLAFIQAFPTTGETDPTSQPTTMQAPPRKPPVPRRPALSPSTTSTDPPASTSTTNPFSTASTHIHSPNDPHASQPHPHPQQPPQHPRRSVELPPQSPSAAKVPPPLPAKPFTSTSASTTTASYPSAAMSAEGQDLGHAQVSHNPFIRQDRPSATRSEDGSGGRVPPLPPRKSTRDVRQGSSYSFPSPKPVSTSALTSPPVPPKPTSLSLSSFSPAQSPSPPVHSSKATPSPSPATVHIPAKLAPQHSGTVQKHTTSNLIRQSLQASKAAQSMKRAQEMLERERNVEVLKRSGASSSAPPPPPPRTRSQSPTKYSSYSSASHSISSRSSHSSAPIPPSTVSAPPLPRRPTHKPSPPPSESSLVQVALARVPSHPSVHRSPFHGHSTSVDSRSSSPRPPSSRGSLDLPRPPAHPDRKPPPLGLGLGLAREGEWEKVYGVNAASSTRGAESSPATTTKFSFYAPLSSDTPTGDETPTMHTPTKGNGNGNDSPTARVFRSKSMHVPGSASNSPGRNLDFDDTPNSLVPPPRRKRPDSVQVLPGSSYNTLSRHVSLSSPRPTHFRRSSLSTTTAPSADINPFGDTIALGVQRLTETFEGLQPKFDKARYKAEAGLSRRGFVGIRGREEVEGLMPRSMRGQREGEWDRWDRLGGMQGAGSGSSPGQVYDEPDVDDEWVHAFEGDSWREKEREGGRERMGVGEEKDNLKLPTGEGWKLL